MGSNEHSLNSDLWLEWEVTKISKSDLWLEWEVTKIL